MHELIFIILHETSNW